MSTIIDFEVSPYSSPQDIKKEIERVKALNVSDADKKAAIKELKQMLSDSEIVS